MFEEYDEDENDEESAVEDDDSDEDRQVRPVITQIFFDRIAFDLTLPHEGGFEICRQGEGHA